MTDRVRTIHINWDAEVTRADPNWRGVDLAPGQEFVLVIGRQ